MQAALKETEMTLISFFTWMAVISAFIAAGLWYHASTVNIPPKEDDNGYRIVIDEGKTDFIPTAEAQVKWNKYAALASGAAALCQAIYTYLQIK